MSTTERERNFTETDGSRKTIFIIVGIASLLVIGLLFLIIRSGYFGGGGTAQQPRLEGAIRSGSPEFEQYRPRIVMDKPEATEAKRALGDIVMTLHTTVRNFTGRTINGLEMYAAVVNIKGEPIKERTVIVIPNRQPELEPNRTIDVPVMLEGFTDADDRANIKMEVTAFRFK